MTTKPSILTFDPSRKLGYGAGPIGGTPELGTVTLGNDNTPDIEVYGRCARAVDDLIVKHQPALIVVEQPFYIKGESNYGTTQLLHGLYGCICGMARSRNVQCWSVAVQTWRAMALGTAKFHGRDGAKQAMLAYCKNVGWVAVDDNAADAGGMWIWGCSTFAPYGQVPRDAFTAGVLAW
ncbi:hypothetical protein HAP48_0043075 [Bradyrhizobium septentrionale]|uniref:Uncharacterized protein n=1 Tax=Bradyrhizobium septentrionale TaxID=1404411 RepID=A0A973W2M0_9BRAD|nr:crossover junction endodeoxyribonuclease RuvC [Bradyrhizobium septentrionale]UGY15242.1 hypothetical protein HAP48_0043075 [Bradyrhizobium septentrionale]UGY23825.1 hypothetical protein HU675_0038740 [Bradyrhizobium septentrionale]